MTDAIVKSVSIANMLNQRAAALEKLRQALDLIGEASRMAAHAHVGFPIIGIETNGRRYGIRISGEFANRADVESRILQDVDADAWGYLMRESGLRSLMDATAREKWDEQIHGGKVPELTQENIEATFSALYDSRADMFERGVIECFRGLSWDYKTNSPCSFGKRIILNFLFSFGTPNNRATDKLDDLIRVFHVLDRKPEPDFRNGAYRLVWDATHAGKSRAENDYIALRWFKKGSGHVTFKRLDLVEALNRIIAKRYPGALPAAR